MLFIMSLHFLLYCFLAVNSNDTKKKEKQSYIFWMVQSLIPSPSRGLPFLHAFKEARNIQQSCKSRDVHVVGRKMTWSCKKIKKWKAPHAVAPARTSRVNSILTFDLNNNLHDSSDLKCWLKCNDFHWTAQSCVDLIKLISNSLFFSLFLQNMWKLEKDILNDKW